VKVDLKIAEVRTLGVAHWEHELKKLIMSLVAAMKKCVMLYKGG